MSRYSTDPLWADIVPLPTDEGGTAHPLAAIAYSPAYAETMSYLRAIMAIPEYSPRALTLTAALIDMNPAHYTVWLFRARCLLTLDTDLRSELTWLNSIALANQKNYQIWHHRNLIVDKLGSWEGEREFVEKMLALDAKNYHVWAYRQWLVKRFALWEDGEMEFVEGMLAADVRNNSAWNYRWYIVNGREGEEGEGRKAGVKGDEEVREREMKYAEKLVELAPQNPSPWGYLGGIVRVSGLGVKALEGVVRKYADVEGEGGVRSSSALNLLADILAEKDEGKKEAGRVLDLLATEYDPIRKNYWEWKKGQLGLVGEERGVDVAA